MFVTFTSSFETFGDAIEFLAKEEVDKRKAVFDAFLLEMESFQEEKRSVEEGELEEPPQVECTLHDCNARIVRMISIPIRTTVAAIFESVEKEFNTKVTMNFTLHNKNAGGVPKDDVKEENAEQKEGEEGVQEDQNVRIQRIEKEFAEYSSPWKSGNVPLIRTIPLNDKSLHMFLGIPQSMWRKHKRITKLTSGRIGKLVARPLYGVYVELEKRTTNVKKMPALALMTKRVQEEQELVKTMKRHEAPVAMYEAKVLLKSPAKPQLPRSAPSSGRTLRQQIEEEILSPCKEKENTKMKATQQQEQIQRVYELAVKRKQDFMEKKKAAMVAQEAKDNPTLKKNSDEMNVLLEKLTLLPIAKKKAFLEKSKLENEKRLNANKMEDKKMTGEQLHEFLSRNIEVELTRRQKNTKLRTQKLDNEAKHAMTFIPQTSIDTSKAGIKDCVDRLYSRDIEARHARQDALLQKAHAPPVTPRVMNSQELQEFLQRSYYTKK